MEIVPQIVIVRKMNVYLKRQSQDSMQPNNVKNIEIVIEVISAEMANVKVHARKI